MGLRSAGFALLAAALLLIAGVLYRNSLKSQIPLVFSPTQILSATWNEYRKNYLEPGSRRTLDKQRQNVTTSEGESYTMLRAVWIGDKDTFDASWKWTHENLQHQNDALFSWLYGQHANGRWGVLTEQNGGNAASDADQDIALALLFAYARWQDPAYLSQAHAIITDIWNKEVFLVGSTPYLAANDLEKGSSSPTAIVNPSYLSPYTYRIFAQADPAHPWNALAESSYALLDKAMAAPLGGSPSANLPPDWVSINKTSGAIAPAPAQSGTSNYGFDAMRAPWRLALTYQWFGDAQAKALLDKMGFLARQWQTNGALASTYAHDGKIILNAESPAMYGTAIGYFIVSDPSDAQKVYEDKLVFLFDPDINAWKQTLSYYDDNWAWFGVALYNRLLPNLTEGLPSGALR